MGKSQQFNNMVTNPKIVFLIVIGLLVYGFISLISVVFLIINHIDAALIAIVSTAGGTAIGNVSGMLTNTRTQTPPAAEGTTSTTTTTTTPPKTDNGTTQPTKVIVANEKLDPVPTTTEGK